MLKKILISACLLGQPVRYNGRGLLLEDEVLDRWRAARMLVPLCPEIAAGFPVPRPPAEIQPFKNGLDVMAGSARVVENTGRDVTESFVLGTQIAVKLALTNGCRFALLADGSPSCGSSFIYSGNHDGETRSGIGAVTAALQEQGVEVFAEHQIMDLAGRLTA